jgi:galactokinase
MTGTSAVERLAKAAGQGAAGIRAPGRANLIGEHTDYNDGFVLPVAIELSTYVVGIAAADGILRLRSLDESGDVVVDIRTGEGPTEGWGRYATGVVRAALDEDYALRGFEGLVATDLPIGAGLSSSAALEVAVAKSILEKDPGPRDLARMCRRAENVYCGMHCGIMDQLAATAGRAEHALFIDCRDESFEPVPVPPNVSVLIIDSAVRRALADSGYNERRAECERAAREMGYESLRDATLSEIEESALDDRARRRARHVISENARVREAIRALRAGDLHAMGRLWAESHRSLSVDFEVSTPEVDALVEIAARTPDVLAARMTGGGFGGCIVALVESGAGDNAADDILAAYKERTGQSGRHWVSRPAAGAEPVNLG